REVESRVFAERECWRRSTARPSHKPPTRRAGSGAARSRRRQRPAPPPRRARDRRRATPTPAEAEGRPTPAPGRPGAPRAGQSPSSFNQGPHEIDALQERDRDDPAGPAPGAATVVLV